MLPLSVRHIAHLLGTENPCDTLLFTTTIDSRTKGDLFFALQGKRSDGHDFLQDVAKRGAIAAIVRKSYAGPSFGLKLIRVDNVVESLHYLAKIAIAKLQPRIVAITGSMGKTTTKDFLSKLLQKRYTVYSSPGNANSQIGLPLSLLSLKGDEEVLVLEMGMTEKGNIQQLATLAPPDIALITTVGLVHAENFTGLDKIAEAKAEIFHHPKTKYGLYYQEMPHKEIAVMTGVCEKISFSDKSLEADFYVKEEGGDLFVYEKGEMALQTPWHLLGGHNVTNFLAAVSAARKMGVTWRDIKEAVPHLVLPPNRLELLQKGSKLFLKDAYNANKTSLCRAFETLSSVAAGKRRVAVISEMLELGSFSEDEHQAVGKFALNTVDALYLIGPGAKVIKTLFDQANKPCYYCENKDILRDTLKKELQEDDVILIKGGRLYNLGDLVEHF